MRRICKQKLSIFRAKNERKYKGKINEKNNNLTRCGKLHDSFLNKRSLAKKVYYNSMDDIKNIRK